MPIAVGIVWLSCLQDYLFYLTWYQLHSLVRPHTLAVGIVSLNRYRISHQFRKSAIPTFDILLWVGNDIDYAVNRLWIGLSR